MNEKKTTVFISYAHEDAEIALKIYDDLRIAGVSPWIDKENILPGDKWKLKIKEAIKSCSYFLAILSSHSVSKEGYVQHELKIAMDVLEEKPPTKRFLIPAKIDNCKPQDDRLNDIQYADFSLNYDRGFSKVLKAIMHETRLIKIKRLRSEPKTFSNEEVKELLDDNLRPNQYIENDFMNNNNGTVTDHLTGLMWQKGGSDKEMSQKKSKDYITILNRTKFGGYTNWRLPTLVELVSLLEKEVSSNGLYINSIFSNKQDWCLCADNRVSGGAFYVVFNDGKVHCINISSITYVRAVRTIPDYS